jgi:hypothetical protein
MSTEPSLSAYFIGQWLIALLNQEFAFNNIHTRVLARDHNLARTRNLVRDHDHALSLTRALTVAPDLDFVYDHDFTPTHTKSLHLDLTLPRDLTFAKNVPCYYADAAVRWSAFARARNLAHDLNLDDDIDRDRERDLTRVCKFPNSEVNFYWELALVLYPLPEVFADDLSRSYPGLNICGLKGRAGNGWLVAPGWIEWDVDPRTAEVRKDSFNDVRPKYLINNGYDLVFPLTNIPLSQLRDKCPEWRSDRGIRALGVLAYFFLLKKQRQKYLNLFKVPHIHALMPRPELWLKPFDDWTETDWNTCGLSALWDIESGVVYWAEGAHHADEMKQVGKPIEQFIDSKT